MDSGSGWQLRAFQQIQFVVAAETGGEGIRDEICWGRSACGFSATQEEGESGSGEEHTAGAAVSVEERTAGAVSSVDERTAGAPAGGTELAADQ